MNEHIKEIELALKWYQMHGIDAYKVGLADHQTNVYIEMDNDISIMVSSSEISFRADLYKNNYKN